MAKSPADRSREFRERRRAQARASLGFAPNRPSFITRSFAEFMKDRYLDLYENLDAFGVFVDGSGLDEETQQFQSQVHRDEPLNALQRAQALVDVFIDAAGELSMLICQFKLEEIERAIDEACVASANLPRGDVEALKASFDEIARLKAIRTELRSPKRHVMPATTAKEE